MSGMPTHDTTKFSLAFAVAAFAMPAGAAALAGLSGIDQIDSHTRTLRLVADVHPQLSEGPISVTREAKARRREDPKMREPEDAKMRSCEIRKSSPHRVITSSPHRLIASVHWNGCA